MRRVLAVDLGGTNLRVAVVADDGSLSHRRAVPTPAAAGADAVVAAIAELTSAVASEASLPPTAGLGVAIPGPLDPLTGIVAFTPNLRGWRDYPLGARLGEQTGRPLRLGNDGNCAAVGEARFGVGRGATDLVYLALGTGVGGGVIAGGRLIEGARGLGGEVGHVVVSQDGPRCTCGSIGCLEAFVGGWAITREATILATTADGEALRRAAEAGPLTPAVVAGVAAAGDVAAADLLERAGRALGAAIGAFLNIFNPELVVIGGGVGTVGEALLAPARRALAWHSFPAARESLRIERSRLGDDTALYGAAALALDAGLPT